MSEKVRRADAERNVAAILDAAVAVLGQEPGAGIAEVARAAGVTRQTVYAHFGDRGGLVGAAVDRTAQQMAETVAALALDEGPVVDALARYLDAGWEGFERHPHLLEAMTSSLGPGPTDEAHAAAVAPLRRLVRRGQRSGELDDRLDVGWAVAAIAALAHATGGEVAAGRMSGRRARAALHDGVLRLLGARSG
ncbi:TetR/AcrR family transcriptional regulator [Iamia sp. SCSIO 61187]|uniref:TetR/AcrR family transcriptional regulator n=1 Tax=Iamia sp. SCSIO 61187 TaxID=2722752 RepID=UPI001C637768|nr:TetR/AcrR family transcriptional regulator [Iamia sp. SCSIO 61187]QYG91402.1 TetR/AcrR family transcriptional regulator [Iamia sp. SCSIO 61187]